MEGKVYAVYFSPTGGSKKGALAVASAFGAPAEIDLTPCTAAPVPASFGPGDVVVFGAPVYGGRLFSGAVRRFSQLQGNGTPCVVTVTYGNRAYDDALAELFDTAKACGFIPVAGAALVAQHTYGDIQRGRPAADDIAADEAFGKKAADKLARGDISVCAVPGNRPYRDGGRGGKFRPLTDAALCVSCGVCAAQCPEQAIDYADVSKIDNDRCIACFRCIAVCPTGAKNMNEEKYNAFAAEFSEKLRARRENEYFI
ncbi:MAG: 4Fe-4S binding protein [Oscillospiraceae bacterium]|nr:4Fe-4S binding protein [Oscillospiraceae bacterium]